MPGSWEFLSADGEERRAFTDRAAVLAVPHEAAAPPNRQRHVVRLLLRGRCWYFKQFGPPSLQNRWRFRTTLPHARDDAEREALVTLALRARGIETPRPVLRGRGEDGRSYYLCAELPGRPLRLWLRDGPVAPSLLALAAAFCGDVLRQGFHLPDLSAEHLFARQEIAFFHFGLIDLHNGRIAAPGPAPLWLCRRVLRHFQRSVQDLPVGRGQALRFAARLLRNAGRGADTRRLLQQLSPLDTAARYEAAGKAADYRDRNPDRTRGELALLARVWPGRPGESVLDAPCGTGRLLPFLRQREHRVVQADRALAMLQQARELGGGTPGALAHALALPFADRAVDGVVMFRFLHHLDRQAAKAAVAEACRVAGRFVVLSFFHPCSVHHVQRRTADLLARRAPRRHAVTWARLRRWFAAHGFVPVRRAAQLPFVRDLWVAGFERR
ncbi:MAG: class I SAM-dependent methyltransferase [Planctomycetota bacterium]